jgi:3-phosphoshikimate 1-carboxyvinyltransferase
VVENLRRLGVEAEEQADGMTIPGRQTFRGGQFDSFGDHRIAMAFAMAGLRAESPLTIRDCANVDTSFPGFVSLARQAGLQITEQQAQAA